MKTFVFSLSVLLSSSLIAQSNVRILAVNPTTHEVTLKNFGTVSQNVGTHFLCIFPDYKQISTMEVLSGSTNIAVNASLTVIWPDGHGTDGELGYYINSTNFAVGTNMRDYMEWGSTGHTRSALAVSQGYWFTGDFVPNDPGFTFTGTGTQHGDAFWTNQTLGCTYITACNFNPAATIDNGTCNFSTCAGCTCVTACNFNPAATLEDGSCEYSTCAGCTCTAACNYNPAAIIHDFSCEYDSCGGCTTPEACNYDASATLDNGTCEYTTCAGCTYSCAANFDPAATIDDGSCDPCSASSCPADFDGNLVVNTNDLLIFMGIYGSVCP